MSSRWTPEAPSGSWLSNADRQTALESHATKSSALAGRWSRLVGKDCGRESTHVRRPCSSIRVPTIGASDALSVGRSVALSLSIPSTKPPSFDAQPNVGTFRSPAHTHEVTASSHAMPWGGFAVRYDHDHRLKLDEALALRRPTKCWNLSVPCSYARSHCVFSCHALGWVRISLQS